MVRNIRKLLHVQNTKFNRKFENIIGKKTQIMGRRFPLIFSKILVYRARLSSFMEILKMLFYSRQKILGNENQNFWLNGKRPLYLFVCALFSSLRGVHFLGSKTNHNDKKKTNTFTISSNCSKMLEIPKNFASSRTPVINHQNTTDKTVLFNENLVT